MEWRARSAAEYRSAAIASQALHLIVSLGLDPALARTALRIVGDELTHAEMAADVAEELGGTLDPLSLKLDALSFPAAADGPLGTLIDILVPDLLLGETLAVPLFRRMREGAEHPHVCRTLDRVLADEAVHRAFGWDLLDALLDVDPAAVRARIIPVIRSAVASFRWSHDGAGPPFDPAHRSLGLIAPHEYREILDDVLQGDLTRRLGARDLDGALGQARRPASDMARDVGSPGAARDSNSPG